VLQHFREVWAADFEFTALPGERPVPVCLVARELKSGRQHRIFQGQFGSAPPYPTGPDVLFVAYYASAELGCHRVLGWPMPERILDLFTEFRDRTNGLGQVAGLLNALTYFGLDAMSAVEKKDLQTAIGNGTWPSRYSPTEILDYCEQDRAALERLLAAMLPQIDMPRALVRGRYMPAAAAMEHNGTPIDMEPLQRLRNGWDGIKDDLIAAIDVHGIYDAGTFKSDRWMRLVEEKGIPWPLLESGNPDLSDETFRQMAKSYELVSPYRELRSSLAELRLNDLAVGKDGRNRTILSAFRSKTGRNQPSNTKYIFGPSVWLRGLIKSPPGHAVAYVDWAQQEFGIAAVLSGDAAMLRAYESGDVYLAFAKQAKMVPADATRESHEAQRELCKQCILGTQYGQGEWGLAQRIGLPRAFARELLRTHHEVNRTFWAWSDAVVDYAMLHGELHTRLGWHVRTKGDPNPRSLRNFPMQANGAEMMRLAACLATERGIEVCAPIHDAFLICAPIDQIDAQVAAMRAAMAEASRAVLSGFELRTDVKIVQWPDRYMDQRGVVMWQRVMGLLDRQDQQRRMA
jgi:DNA polymerase family A